LASVIVDRTHAVRRSGMQAASAAISLVGFGLDLMWHKDLTRMRWRNVARSGGTSLGLAGGGSWESRCGSTAVARSAAAWERESDGGEWKKTKGMGSTPPRLTIFIEGSTETICCSSLARTTRPNGSIPRSSRED
jgi:hypothetical protein